VTIVAGAIPALTLGLVSGVAAATAGPAGATTTCSPTGFMRDNINLTAAMINPANVSGKVDATGCNIGVYYGPDSAGHVSRAEIFGANYFGVVNNGGAVDVTNSSVHNIGETPFNGDQHGVGIYFASGALNTGSLENNTVSQYQKGGIVVNGGSADIENNTVQGLGPVDFIAGNGIQVADGATGTVTNNDVSGNAYTGTNGASSTGILVFGGCGEPVTNGVDVRNNSLTGNDMGVALANYSDDCSVQTSLPTDETVRNNKLSNDATSNVSGNSGPCTASCQGYQAGILDVGNGDVVRNNSIAGVGYTPAQMTSTIVVVPIDTSLATAPMLRNNHVR
jgi:hypothetical protein